MEIDEAAPEHPKDAAKVLYENLMEAEEEHNFLDDFEVRAIFEDVGGILLGIKDQRVRQGQPRLASQLSLLIEKLSNDTAKTSLAHIIGDCAEYGFVRKGKI